MEIKINGNKISEFSLIGSYDKAKIIETEQLMILKSYDSFICLYYKPMKTIINNIDFFKYSNTTKRHYEQFIYNCGFVNHEIYLNDFQFNKLIETFYNFGSIENLFNNIFKYYEMEKLIIETEINKFSCYMENNIIYGFFNENSLYDLNKCYGSFKPYDGYKLTDYKTITKEKLFYERKTEYNTLCICIELTLNKKETKLKNYKIKILNKYGLSFYK